MPLFIVARPSVIHSILDHADDEPGNPGMSGNKTAMPPINSTVLHNPNPAISHGCRYYDARAAHPF
jgi:hypothetical protein